MNTVARTPSDLDARIAAAFGDEAKSSEVAALIKEAEAAALSAGEAAERARERALDPALSANPPPDGRRRVST